MSSSYNHYLPVPYLKVDRDATIVGYSEEALALFDITDNKLIYLVDEESLEKLNKFVFSSKEVRKLELNLKTRQKSILLFQAYAQWDAEDYCHLVFLPEDQSIQALTQKLIQLQQRLSDTDFELFEKKEQLQEAMARLNKLSGPFIPVFNQLALVPLFGDITEEKMKAITANAIKSAYEGEYETILFDFTATGSIEPGGIQKMHELFQILLYMGNPIIKIIGINPKQAKELNLYGQTWPVEFEPTLKSSLSHYIASHQPESKNKIKLPK